jgi:AraC-like DNA-binding protein
MTDYDTELAVLQAAGLDLSILADPNARISHAVAGQLLRASLQKTDNRALGLQAGELIEPGDFGVLEYVARTCPDFRTALECCCRYMRLLDDDLDASVVEEGNASMWKSRWTSGQRPPAMNDFVVSASLTIGRRLLGTTGRTMVHLMHAEATDAAEYERVFRVPVVLGAKTNAVVFPRGELDQPLPHANRDLLIAFEAQARQLLDQLAGVESVTARVRRYVIERLRYGDVGMLQVAQKVHMSPATLRRRLAEEGSTLTDIVTDVRRELALRHLVNKDLAVSEVAFLLGFSNVSALSRAFKRWTGQSPADYRAAHLG